MSPYLAVPLVILAGVVLVTLVLWQHGLRRRDDPASENFDGVDTLATWPAQATRILTTHERLAYGTLLRAFPDYMVLAQVPLSRFLKVSTRRSYAEWLRRVGNQCADLVVCDMASQVVAVVMVQKSDASRSERAMIRRERVARILKSVGIRMLVWVEGALPSPNAAREAILPTPLAGGERHAAGRDAVVVDGAAGATPLEPGIDPPSTWHDELDSRPTPLKPTPPGIVNR